MSNLRIFKREYFQKKEAGVEFIKRNFSFISLSPGAGSTSLSLAFAKTVQNKLSQKVSFIEISENKNYGLVYDKLGFELRKCEKLSENIFLDEGIYFHLLRSDSGANNPQTLTKTLILEKFALPKTSNNIFDISSEVIKDESLIETVLQNSDETFIVIDPLPSSFLNFENTILMLKEKIFNGANIKFILNKKTNKIPINNVKSFFEIKNFIEVLFISPEILQECEYNCKICTEFSKYL